MSEPTQRTKLKRVEHILASGTGTLDFAVADEESYYTWRGTEVADWRVDDVQYVKNTDEDRIILYPEGEYFTCEIEAENEEHNIGPVRCYCE